MSNLTIPFGKFRGQPVANIDSGYISWMLDNADHGWVAENREALEQVLADERALAIAAMPEYELNDGQKQAAIELVLWLQDADLRTAKLEGGAGYGKSFAATDVVKQAQAMGYKVNAMAPSYVATQVLAKQLEPLGVTTMTIARTLKMTVEYNGPEQLYVFSEDTPSALAKLLGPKKLLILDEYSMTHDYIGQALLDAVNTYGGKLLCVGDLKQLPPVKQTTPSVLAGIATSTMLTEPMRYSTESTLFSLEQHARHQPYGIEWKAFEGSEVVLHADRDSLMARYVSDYQANPKEDLRMMMFKRVDVVAANRRIRNALFGFDASEENPVLDGEKLMVMATITIPDTQDGVRFYSSTTFQATKVEEDEQGYSVVVNGRARFRIMFMVSENAADVNKAGGREYNETVRELAEQAKESGSWADWRAYKARFIPVGYAYCMTVHRCQGQTVDRTYFSPAQLLASGSMGSPLTYVAATRARKAVHVLIGG